MSAPVGVHLCADDFALSEGVSCGILAALAAQRLSATSAITTRPFWLEGAKLLRDLRSKAEIGLHLNLTLAAPLTAMRNFAPSGTFPQIAAVAKADGRTLPLAEIAIEISAQIDAFTDRFDRPPAFIDGHQHVHVAPALRQTFFGVLTRKGFAGKLWLRDCGDRPSRILRRRAQVRKALTVAWLARGFAHDAAAHGFTTNDGFSGFSAFSAARDYDVDFARYLIAPGTAHLVMCHPGIVDQELQRVDPVTDSRERELAFLLSSRFAECFAQRRVVLAQG